MNIEDAVIEDSEKEIYNYTTILKVDSQRGISSQQMYMDNFVQGTKPAVILSSDYKYSIVKQVDYTGGDDGNQEELNPSCEVLSFDNSERSLTEMQEMIWNPFRLDPSHSTVYLGRQCTPYFEGDDFLVFKTYDVYGEAWHLFFNPETRDL